MLWKKTYCVWCVKGESNGGGRGVWKQEEEDIEERCEGAVILALFIPNSSSIENSGKSTL